MIIRIALIAATLAFPVATCFARTIVVAEDGSGDTTLLSEGLAAAANGDTVKVEPGVYAEEGYQEWGEPYVRFHDRSLTLVGTGSEPREVQIRAKLLFNHCDDVLVENMAFEGLGQAILLFDGNYTIRKCHFENNGSAENYTGGAIGATAPLAILVEECVFVRNYAGSSNSFGGAISLSGPTIEVRDCVFIGNSARKGGALRLGCPVGPGHSITGSIFIKNRAERGAAIWVGCADYITHCTLLGNIVTGSDGGSAIECLCEEETPVTHCIIANTENGFGVYCDYYVRLECNDVWGNDLGETRACGGLSEYLGNGSADPLFCNPEIGDVGLTGTSPCLSWSVGERDCGLIGALGPECGVVALESMSWGQIKLRYEK